MDKKIAIAAIIVVAIVVIAAVAVVLTQPAESNQKVIYWTTIAPVNQKAALQAGTVDGAVSWEPYVSAAVDDGTASVVVRSDQVWPEHPCCVIAVTNSFSNNPANQQLIARVVKANMVATDWLVQTINAGSGANYTSLIQMGAQFSNVQPSVVESAINNIEYSNQLTPSVVQWFANFTGMFASLGQLSLPAGYPTSPPMRNPSLTTPIWQWLPIFSQVPRSSGQCALVTLTVTCISSLEWSP